VRRFLILGARWTRGGVRWSDLSLRKGKGIRSGGQAQSSTSTVASFKREEWVAAAALAQGSHASAWCGELDAASRTIAT
jgi:hypothetical protein